MTTSPAAKGLSLQWKMLIGFLTGLILGLIAYSTQRDAAWVEFVTTYVTGPIGQIFLRLLFMLVIPLLFSALVVGIAEMGEIRSLKRVGIRTLVYTVVVSSIAVAVSLLVVNLLQPGAGVDKAAAAEMLQQSAGRASEIVQAGAEQPSGIDAFVSIIPNNLVEALGSNSAILSVMFFALFFGIGLLITDTPNARSLKRAFEGLFDVTMHLILIVIKLAPIAVACFMFNLAALFGWELLIRLSAYVGVVLLALGIQMFVVFPLLLATFGKKNPIDFFRETQEASLMAFSTASSNATLPTSLKVAEQQLKLPRRISRFVLTIGATANQNGTAMFEGVTVIFLAQFFGIELNLWQQLTVMLVCILGGIGTAGIPAGSLPVIALILAMVGIQPEAIALVLGVDRFLDMCRTTLNVVGDLVAAQVISAGEPEEAVEPLPRDGVSELDALDPKYRAILCDIWGVVHDGDRILPGVERRLLNWKAEGRQIILVTNAPRPAETVQRYLDRLGLPRSAYDAIASSGEAGIAALTDPARPVGFLGTHEDKVDLVSRGVMISSGEFAELACTGLDEWRDEPEQYREQLAGWAQAGVVMHCLNPDRVVIHCGRREACAGALADIYEALGGHVEWYGKPHAPIYDHARALAGSPPLEAMLTIGDGLPTDILGAGKYGMDAIYVSHGIHAGEPVPDDFASRHGLGEWRPIMTVKGLA